MIIVEGPENAVHPKLMENLLLTIQAYTSNTKILMTSHSPYLMREFENLIFTHPQLLVVTNDMRYNPPTLVICLFVHYKYATSKDSPCYMEPRHDIHLRRNNQSDKDGK